jgi:hypothetical protein
MVLYSSILRRVDRQTFKNISVDSRVSSTGSKSEENLETIKKQAESVASPPRRQ